MLPRVELVAVLTVAAVVAGTILGAGLAAALPPLAAAEPPVLATGLAEAAPAEVLAAVLGALALAAVLGLAAAELTGAELAGVLATLALPPQAASAVTDRSARLTGSE